VWENCSQLARRAIYLSQIEALDLGCSEVDTVHLLISLLRDDQSVAAALLQEHLAIRLLDIHKEIGREIKRGEGVVGQETRFTDRVTRVDELAHEEVQRLGGKYVGTEHLLLGLAREEEGVAGRVLRKVGADAERLRPEVQAMGEGKESLARRVKNRFLEAVERDTGIPVRDLLGVAMTRDPEWLVDEMMPFLVLSREGSESLQSIPSL
jgi:ATP-dependent Clp protease ATP-binding subunit ClpC